MQEKNFTFKQIGVIHSPHRQAEGTPIQPCYAAGAEGIVELFPEFAGALSDLNGFERIWLLYVFDRTNGWQPRVIPFRDTTERGLFSTRAPRRPNPLGISCVRLLRVDGLKLHVAEIDILDGSPLLDIKPYAPEYDSYPQARAGWLDKAAAPLNFADRRFEK